LSTGTTLPLPSEGFKADVTLRRYPGMVKKFKNKEKADTWRKPEGNRQL
jgi:hypothetical protein